MLLLVIVPEKPHWGGNNKVCMYVCIYVCVYDISSHSNAAAFQGAFRSDAVTFRIYVLLPLRCILFKFT